MPQKLTDSLVKDVKELPPPAHGNKVYYDPRLPGSVAESQRQARGAS